MTSQLCMPHRCLSTFLVVAVSAMGLMACASSDDVSSNGSASSANASDATENNAENEEISPESNWQCQHEDGAEDPDFLQQLGCQTDFDVLSSEPLSASIPGARSCKTIVDQLDDDNLYFQNSKKYKIHWEFASEHLSGQGKPPVPALGQFNQTEYYSPDRRFLLGAITYYEEPGVWVYEISPYDTSTAEMIDKASNHLAENTYFGADLLFHPTSVSVENEAAKLPESVKIITTDELFAGVTYQPLNLGTSAGKLRFLNSQEFASEDLQFRDIVVLDHVPNDIGVVSGIITAELQTPLSHINVLSQNRGTPNMALIGAHEEETLKALNGKWVELTVEAFDWSIKEVTQEEADSWWEANKPQEVTVPNMDLTVTDLRDIPELLEFSEPKSVENPPSAEDLSEALAKAIPAFGGKASHYAGFAFMDESVPHPQAFAIPVFYYRQHMEENGLDQMVDDMLANPDFQGDSSVRADLLDDLRDAIRDAPINQDFLALLTEKMQTDFPGVRMRFRSSTNAEDLDGFTGAGLYTSKSGDLNDPDKPPEEAVRKVWASIWNYKAYDEREYRSIDHQAIGMALLCHRSFPDEEANGVALTGNIFDTSGLEPGFYINVQYGGDSVVLPEAGTTTDQIVYYFYQPGQPALFLSHSNMVPEGETVLTSSQLYSLGQALDTIHKFWMDLYGPELGSLEFYAMDVEFKFDGEPGEEPQLFIKQARPHPGWGL